MTDWETYRNMVIKECVEGSTPIHTHDKKPNTHKCIVVLKVTRSNSLIRVLTMEGYVLIIERGSSYKGDYYLVGVCEEVKK